jgi:uncharacterized protein YukE
MSETLSQNTRYNFNSSAESIEQGKNTKLVFLKIAVLDGKIKIADVLRREATEHDMLLLENNQGFEITSNTDKKSIIKYINEEIKLDEQIRLNAHTGFDNQENGSIRHNNERPQSDEFPFPSTSKQHNNERPLSDEFPSTSKQPENVAESNIGANEKGRTAILKKDRYITYPPTDDYYDTLDKLKKDNSNNIFDDEDVMIYLSELRKKNNGSVPEHLKQFHDILYFTITSKGINRDEKWKNYSKNDIPTGLVLSEGTNLETIFNKIWNAVKTDKKISIKSIGSYETVKRNLDAAFNTVTQKEGIPQAYKTALEQMKSAIDSMTEFNYNGSLIFTYDHMTDNRYRNMKNLTDFLKKIDFNKSKEKTRDPSGNYPPSLTTDSRVPKGFRFTQKNKIITKSWTDFSDKQIIEFLLFISSSPEERKLKPVSTINSTKERESKSVPTINSTEEPNYGTIKSDLYAAFETVINKKKISDAYKNALEQMKSAIDSMTDFNYNGSLIFTYDHMTDNSYKNMITLTKNLKNIDFKNRPEKEMDQISGTFPPSLTEYSIPSKGFSFPGYRQKKVISWKNTNPEEVKDFLLYISSSTEQHKTEVPSGFNRNGEADTAGTIENLEELDTSSIFSDDDPGH